MQVTYYTSQHQAKWLRCAPVMPAWGMVYHPVCARLVGIEFAGRSSQRRAGGGCISRSSEKDCSQLTDLDRDDIDNRLVAYTHWAIAGTSAVIMIKFTKIKSSFDFSKDQSIFCLVIAFFHLESGAAIVMRLISQIELFTWAISVGLAYIQWYSIQSRGH